MEHLPLMTTTTPQEVITFLEKLLNSETKHPSRIVLAQIDKMLRCLAVIKHNAGNQEINGWKDLRWD